LAELAWTEDALQDLHKLDRPLQKRVLKKITWLGRNFHRLTPELLAAELDGAFKIRIGAWRVIYTVEENGLTIQAIGHRSEIHKS